MFAYFVEKLRFWLCQFFPRLIPVGANANKLNEINLRELNNFHQLAGSYTGKAPWQNTGAKVN
jgi:hypothetical protein